jgi:hypothetical protein
MYPFRGPCRFTACRVILRRASCPGNGQSFETPSFVQIRKETAKSGKGLYTTRGPPRSRAAARRGTLARGAWLTIRALCGPRGANLQAGSRPCRFGGLRRRAVGSHEMGRDPDRRADRAQQHAAKPQKPGTGDDRARFRVVAAVRVEIDNAGSIFRTLPAVSVGALSVCGGRASAIRQCVATCPGAWPDNPSGGEYPAGTIPA